MKALILAGGKGTRLEPITLSTPKHLIPVANKPIIFYSIEQILESGIDDIGIVVSAESLPSIREAVSRGFRGDAKFTFILQTEPLGLAHAVKTGRTFIGNHNFLLLLGDNLFQDRIKNLVTQFNRRSPDALIAVKAVADARAFGVAELNSKNLVERVEEKPKEPKSNLALTGAYLFTPDIFEIISQLNPSGRGEYEITDAIQRLIETGKVVDSTVLKGWWLDAGEKESLLEANRVTLNEYLVRQIKGTVSSDSQIIGNVEIVEGSTIANSMITGPVSISRNCHIVDSVIGPYTSIGSETTIKKSAVEDSIILSGCRIFGVRTLKRSIIGNTAELIMRGTVDRDWNLCLGDNSVLEL